MTIINYKYFIMTEAKKIYLSKYFSDIGDYLDRELTFFDDYYESIDRVIKKIIFAGHFFYWQFIFTLCREVSLKLSQKINLPFYIHKNRLEILITDDSSLKCPHCQHSCQQSQTDEHMHFEQIKYFINESTKAGKKWPFIVITGEEPALHPNIFEICDLLIDYKRNFSPNTKISILTGSTSPKTREILARLHYIIHQKKNLIAQDKNLATFNVAPIDIEKYQSPLVNFSCGCSFPALSGTALTKYGFYPCRQSAYIDRIMGLNLGIKDIKSRTGKNFRTQLQTLCQFCGYFKNSADDIYNPDDISPTWMRIYRDYEKKRPKMREYGKESTRLGL